MSVDRKFEQLQEILNDSDIKSKNSDEKIIHELINNKKPNLIYGCANHAELVWNYLNRFGLLTEAFIVDSQYYKEDWYIGHTKVKDIADYEDRLSDYNIVIGFCDISKSRFLRDNGSLVKNKFYFLWEPLEMYRWDKAYIDEHWEEFEEVYYGLKDTLSRNVLAELIKAKLYVCGNHLLNLADSRQYFNELTFCRNSKDEIFVDCGAYTGDTIKKYIEFVDGSYKKIYAFEPDPKNFNIMKDSLNNFPNIELLNKGTWKEENVLEFEEKGSASQIIKDKGKITVPVTTIDNIVGEDKITFIKMDVEGSELESLLGASKTIARNMPKLAICCYHKEGDLIDLYHYIKSFDNNKYEYQIYLRHHSNSVYETVLYAIPNMRDV